LVGGFIHGFKVVVHTVVSAVQICLLVG